MSVRLTLGTLVLGQPNHDRIICTASTGDSPETSRMNVTSLAEDVYVVMQACFTSFPTTPAYLEVLSHPLPVGLSTRYINIRTTA